MLLYHGTLWTSAQRIMKGGINLAFGKTGTDFGPGFYTTTSERQARSWAWQLAAQAGPGRRGGVVTLTADRGVLARCETLLFVRGDYDAEDFWSFVFHCRGGSPDHGRGGKKPMYDVVCGPVAAFWTQRLAIADADQISFHTSTVKRILKVTRIERVP